jgi:type II secretory pathway component PulF
MRYQVTALVDGSRVQTLAVEADDARQARALTQERGYAVLAVRRGLGALPAFLPWARRGRRFPLQLFSQEMRVMLEAGLTLPEAL